MKIFVIKFYFYGSKKVVPINYNDKLLSFLHTKILGKDNPYHDSISLYSISPLFNSKTTKSGLIFENGAIWNIRTPSIDVFKDIYLKAKNAISEEFGYGLVLKNVEYSVEDIDVNGELVVGCSPVYLGQNKQSDKPDHITYKHGNEMSSAIMKRNFQSKAKSLGYDINENDFNIEFVDDDTIKTKCITIGTIPNITTSGKIKITGNSDVIGLCYGFGVGISTGCGFGYLYNFNMKKNG